MDYSRYSDFELITALREDTDSSNEAFNTIFFKYMSQLFGYCLFKSESREEAEELMQETWIRFYNSIKSGKSTNNILALLFTISRNLSINKYKEKNRKKNLNISALSSIDYDSIADSYNFQNEIEKDEILGILELAVNSLDEKYKETVLLYWFGELNYRQIAEICDETEDCIRRRFERATKKLHSILVPYI